MIQTRKKTDDELTLHRSAQIKAVKMDEEGESEYRFELSFSSEDAYERWFGMEILGHESKEVRMDWVGSGNAPLLLDHDMRNVIGVIEKASIGNSRGVATVRFSKNEKAQEVRQDVIDGIRSNVSVGYIVHKMVLQEESDEGPDIYRVTDWEPLEISIVGIPADQTVGVGRNGEPAEALRRHIESFTKSNNPAKTMDPDKTETKGAKTETEKKNPSVSVQERDNAVIAERKRVNTITALGRKYDLADDAETFIDEGKNESDFRKHILDKLEEKSKKEMPTMESIGLSRQEQGRYSIRNAVLAVLNARNGVTDPWRNAGLEREVSEHLADERGRDAKGVIVPQDALISREFLLKEMSRLGLRAAGDPVGVSVTNNSGANLVGTDLRADMFIQALRDRAVVMQMGVRMLPGLIGDVDIPKDGTQPSVAWVGEDTAPAGSDVDFASVALSFKTIAGWQRITQRLLKQSTPQAEDIVRGNLLSALALGLQAAVINGAGSATEPEGILQLGSLATVPLATDGAAPTYNSIIDLETELAQDNADIGTLGYLTNSKVRGKLKKTQKFSGTNGDPVWEKGEGMGWGELNGYRAGVTNAVPSNLTKGSGTNLSAIIFGNFADIILGMWGGIDLVVDTTTHIDKRGIVVRVFQDADIKITRDESFAAIVDAVTA